MATAKEREEFIVMFAREYPKRTTQECTRAARSLLRLAKTHGTLAIMYCNGPEHLNGPAPYDWQKQPEQHAAWQKRNGADMEAWAADLERRRLSCANRILELCAGFKLSVILGSDPRGYTVKVKFPSGRHNTWGGASDGWGVPQ